MILQAFLYLKKKNEEVKPEKKNEETAAEKQEQKPEIKKEKINQEE